MNLSKKFSPVQQCSSTHRVRETQGCSGASRFCIYSSLEAGLESAIYMAHPSQLVARSLFLARPDL